LYRAWRERRRLDVTLTGAFNPDPDDLTGDAQIRIYNPTSAPLLVEGAGFELSSGARLRWDTNTQGHSGTQRLEYRLQPHEAITLAMDVLVLIPEANGGAVPVRAYVDWAGNKKPTTVPVPKGWLERWAALARDSAKR
jgi:hypothetical protein